MESAHSEEWFKAYRDFWWNPDFLELMAKRLDLGACRRLLDVGCGQCHWSRLLVPFLQKPSEVHGIDLEPKWSSAYVNLRPYFEHHGASLDLRQGDAHALPYDCDSFDVVTCQTTLIHLKDPRAAFLEMIRVTRPGGLIFCAEPNNLASVLVRSSLSAEDSIENVLKDVQHELILERGKTLLGEGDSSYGDLLVGLFHGAGLEGIRVFLSDKAIALFPPYQGPEQQAMLRSMEEWEAECSGPADLERCARYLSAFGDRYVHLLDEMKARRESCLAEQRKAIQGLSYCEGGASLMYLVSGRKPDRELGHAETPRPMIHEQDPLPGQLR